MGRSMPYVRARVLDRLLCEFRDGTASAARLSGDHAGRWITVWHGTVGVVRSWSVHSSERFTGSRRLAVCGERWAHSLAVLEAHPDVVRFEHGSSGLRG